MDYNNLTPQQQSHLWESLKDSQGWQEIRKKLLLKKGALPEIQGLDSKEAFIYQAIRNQIVDEVIAYPDFMLSLIRDKA